MLSFKESGTRRPKGNLKGTKVRERTSQATWCSQPAAATGCALSLEGFLGGGGGASHGNGRATCTSSGYGCSPFPTAQGPRCGDSATLRPSGQRPFQYLLRYWPAAKASMRERGQEARLSHSTWSGVAAARSSGPLRHSNSSSAIPLSGTAAPMERLYSQSLSVTGPTRPSAFGPGAEPSAVGSPSLSGANRCSATGSSSATSRLTSSRWSSATCPTLFSPRPWHSTQKMAAHSSFLAWQIENCSCPTTLQAIPPAFKILAVSLAHLPQATVSFPSFVSPSAEALKYSKTCVLSAQPCSRNVGEMNPF
mmetsp:Transcript_9290/g.22384  ORF Transcript_9290/g.22384 Transcript_9290/m.22384 type:complete len:308 (-) Transcript_9290:296-1219(-)